MKNMLLNSCLAFTGVFLPGSGTYVLAGELPQFMEHVIDANVGKVCYAVTLADVNNDQQTDIVALTENRVIWYEAPGWQPHVILKDQTPLDNVCIAPHDIDGDGMVDFAIGAGWTKTGTVHWIRRGKAPNDLWTVHSIGEERSVHRARWADVLGHGKPQLVISPLNASVGTGVRLTAFEVPADPVNDRWPAVVLNGELNRMHNHWHSDFDSDGRPDTLTASQEGVTLVRQSSDGWSAVRLADGAPGDDPLQRGAGEIKTGRLANGRPFICTVEPMHGHSIAVYTPPSADTDSAGKWQRTVIDSGFQRGHAIWAADMDGDGSDEIVFGHSDTPQTFGVIVYRSVDPTGSRWDKQVVDSGGMATEDLVVADVTGDGRPDIIAGGRATHNVKLYVNSSTAARASR